ncbi:MAG: MotA/TolQ/ExbB proton channel family protein [Deltaproteobacteria bacterium]|nr:MotA/TolQ/ExbB proton channel family protein [Deltaproteobacteria bacterium]
MQGLAKFISHGGFFMYVNAVCLITVLAVVVERFIFLLFKGQINAKGLLEQLRKLIQANNVDRAIRLCGSTNAPLLRVAKAGLVQVHRGEEAIATSVEEALVETTPDVKKRIPSLWSLANIATLVGLLGTVLGLIKSFAAVAAQDPAKQKEELAKGISEALHHTALGLSIAVTAIIFHLILTGMAKKVVADLELFSMKLENFLVTQVRGGGVAAPAPAPGPGPVAGAKK